MPTKQSNKHERGNRKATSTTKEKNSNVAPDVESVAHLQKKVSIDHLEATQATKKRSSLCDEETDEDSSIPLKRSTERKTPDQTKNNNQVEHTDGDGQAMGKNQSSFLNKETDSELLLPIMRKLRRIEAEAELQGKSCKEEEHKDDRVTDVESATMSSSQTTSREISTAKFTHEKPPIGMLLSCGEDQGGRPNEACDGSKEHLSKAGAARFVVEATYMKRKSATKEDSTPTKPLKKQALDNNEANPTAQEKKSKVTPDEELLAHLQKNVSVDRLETQATKKRSSLRDEETGKESSVPLKRSTERETPDQIENNTQFKHTDEDGQAMGKNQSSFLNQDWKSGLLLPTTRKMFLRHDGLQTEARQERPIVVHRSPLLALDNDRALIITNSRFSNEPSPLFEQLWNSAKVRICAGGGANWLRVAHLLWKPDLIVSDLESLTSQTREYYKKSGVAIEKVDTGGQSSKDAVEMALRATVSFFECSECCVFGAVNGRFDQVRLFHWTEEPKLQSLWLYDDSTMAFLLPAHVENRIELALPPLSGDTTNHVGEGRTCGIIPLGAPCKSMTLTGFESNLTDYPSPFKDMELISKRIAQEADEPNGIPLSVTVSSPVIFTAEVFSGKPEK
ncbi:thiamine pyrophosphokinase [Fistulifera solaris]|uniref:Thiamine pyrophosphokinase n=1 Tax=Fistulifera solaris TaxID=1519565 RepID=A0A1Z5J5K6_FISSO|nr:thiamine pyrophosphokinase [Fistulifera solaris]|eukprot:GAX09274.1 thiamine pyrophosphokinase [Fistulifera solaris]